MVALTVEVVPVLTEDVHHPVLVVLLTLGQAGWKQRYLNDLLAYLLPEGAYFHGRDVFLCVFFTVKYYSRVTRPPPPQKKKKYRREEVSHNTSLTGVPVKVGQTLKNHSILCIREKIPKKFLNVYKGLLY